MEYKSTAEITGAMAEYANKAVEFSLNTFKKTLDYSEESIQEVENMLAIMYEAKPAGLADSNILYMAKLFGGYLGEIMRKRWKGEWSMEEADHAADVELVIHNQKLYPVKKVYYRLVNGPTENVWNYYQSLKRNI